MVPEPLLGLADLLVELVAEFFLVLVLYMTFLLSLSLKDWTQLCWTLVFFKQLHKSHWKGGLIQQISDHRGT